MCDRGDVTCPRRFNRRQRVVRPDLLARQVGAAGVGNGHLDNCLPRPDHFGGDLGIDVEPVVIDAQPHEQIRAEELVTGLNIRQPLAVQHIEELRQQLVAQENIDEESDPSTLQWFYTKSRAG